MRGRRVKKGVQKGDEGREAEVRGDVGGEVVGAGGCVSRCPRRQRVLSLTKTS